MRPDGLGSTGPDGSPGPNGIEIPFDADAFRATMEHAARYRSSVDRIMTAAGVVLLIAILLMVLVAR